MRPKDGLMILQRWPMMLRNSSEMKQLRTQTRVLHGHVQYGLRIFERLGETASVRINVVFIMTILTRRRPKVSSVPVQATFK